MNLNKLFKAKLDKEFPPKKYPCGCEMLCQRFGGADACDNCTYCGSDNPDQHRSTEDMEYQARNGRAEIEMMGVF